MGQTSNRVVILIDRYLPILGGAQNNVHQVARGLVDEDFHITVLTRIVFPGLRQQESIDGIQVIRFGESRNRLLSKFYCVAAIVRYLIKHKNDYDSVLCVPCIKLTDLLPAFLASRVIASNKSQAATSPTPSSFPKKSISSLPDRVRSKRVTFL